MSDGDVETIKSRLMWIAVWCFLIMLHTCDAGSHARQAHEDQQELLKAIKDKK